MIEVMVNGCNGKMGQIVCDLVDKNQHMILKCGADKVDTGYFEQLIRESFLENTHKAYNIIIAHKLCLLQ